jgi:hypothetical protein
VTYIYRRYISWFLQGIYIYVDYKGMLSASHNCLLPLLLLILTQHRTTPSFTQPCMRCTLHGPLHLTSCLYMPGRSDRGALALFFCEKKKVEAIDANSGSNTAVPSTSSSIYTAAYCICVLLLPPPNGRCSRNACTACADVIHSSCMRIQIGCACMPVSDYWASSMAVAGN